MKPTSGNDVRETARYIEQLAKELRVMAGETKLDFLAYLLGMVEDEAAATTKRLTERERT